MAYFNWGLVDLDGKEVVAPTYPLKVDWHPHYLILQSRHFNYFLTHDGKPVKITQ